MLQIKGNVIKRSTEAVNLDLKTGKIEVAIDTVEILSQAKELPIPVFGDQDYPEDLRLKFRFLDLRKEEMQKHYSKVKSNLY